ncbi:MAG: hypothetical protein AB1521_10220 [Bacteroidota bacterium]
MKYKLVTLFLLFAAINLSAQNDEFFEPKVTISAYGELHYNSEKTDNRPVSQMLDFHRFVTFLGYSWSEKWSFKSELELEHNFVEGGDGELELEQAYVNYHYADWFGFQAGVVLPSIGLINEYHEPPTFLGVERPEYNSKIIPTTWFGNGIAFYGRYMSFDYKITIMEGLNNEKFSESNGIRNGRRKGFKSDAKNLLYSVRLDYVGLPGLKIGGSFTYNKASGDTSSNKINIIDLHGRYERDNIYANFELGNIDYEKGNLQTSRGYYFDLGYNVGSLLNIETKVIPFVRYTDYNTASETLSGGNSEKQNHYMYWMVGLSVKPLDQVVFKADYGVRKRELGDLKTKSFNLGVGYMF